MLFLKKFIYFSLFFIKFSRFFKILNKITEYVKSFALKMKINRRGREKIREKRKNIFKKGIDKAGRVWYNVQVVRKANAGMAQSVEHVIGNDEVISSILITSSKKKSRASGFFFLYSSLFSFHSSLFSKSTARLFQIKDKREERKENVAFLPLVEKHCFLVKSVI